MGLSRDEAWAHLQSWTPGEPLRRHARAVEVVMRAAAPRYGGEDADPEVWGITGMLHDADYEQWPGEHPARIVAWLRERGEESMAYAISAHYTKWGVAYRSRLDRALLACDELTGFVMACCYVRPDGIASLQPKSVMKKLRSEKFAAGVERTEVQAGFDELGIEPAQHIQFILDALTPHAAELGLDGSAS